MPLIDGKLCKSISIILIKVAGYIEFPPCVFLMQLPCSENAFDRQYPPSLIFLSNFAMSVFQFYDAFQIGILILDIPSARSFQFLILILILIQLLTSATTKPATNKERAYNTSNIHSHLLLQVYGKMSENNALFCERKGNSGDFYYHYGWSKVELNMNEKKKIINIAVIATSMQRRVYSGRCLPSRQSDVFHATMKKVVDCIYGQQWSGTRNVVSPSIPKLQWLSMMIVWKSYCRYSRYADFSELIERIIKTDWYRYSAGGFGEVILR